MARAVFRERLVPGWPVFAFALAFIALIAIAYGAVLGSAVGLALFLVCGAIAIPVIISASPVVEADGAGIRAGAATLPVDCIGTVEILDATAMAELRAQGPGAMATAFTLLRPSRSRVAVRISVDDPDDPHPCWFVTSRRPAELLAALQ